MEKWTPKGPFDLGLMMTELKPLIFQPGQIKYKVKEAKGQITVDVTVIIQGFKLEFSQTGPDKIATHQLIAEQIRQTITNVATELASITG